MIRALALPTALLALWASSAGAQGICDRRDVIVSKLAARYGEVQVATGLAGPLVMEIWANCQTRSWSILKTYPNGTTCMMAAGSNWQGVGCPPGQSA